MNSPWINTTEMPCRKKRSTDQSMPGSEKTLVTFNPSLRNSRETVSKTLLRLKSINKHQQDLNEPC